LSASAITNKIVKEKKIWQGRITLNPGDGYVKTFRCKYKGTIEEGKYDFIGTTANYGVEITLGLNTNVEPQNIAGEKTNLNTGDYTDLSIDFLKDYVISITCNNPTADVVEILYSLRGYILK